MARTLGAGAPRLARIWPAKRAYSRLCCAAGPHNAVTSPRPPSGHPRAAMLNRLTDTLDFQAQALGAARRSASG